MDHLVKTLFALLWLCTLCRAQTSTTSPTKVPTDTPTTTEGYFLNDCPSATGIGMVNCIFAVSERLWISDGPCQGAATKGNDDVFSSCYCRQQVEMASCFETVCPQSPMVKYTSSISKYDCPASVWAAITSDVGSHGGSGGAAPTGESESRSGTGSAGGQSGKNGAVGAAAPVLLSALLSVVSIVVISL